MIKAQIIVNERYIIVDIDLQKEAIYFLLTSVVALWKEYGRKKPFSVLPCCISYQT